MDPAGRLMGEEKKAVVKVGLQLPDQFKAHKHEHVSGGGKTETLLLAGAYIYAILNQLHNHRLY